MTSVTTTAATSSAFQAFREGPDRLGVKAIPFYLMHLACGLVFVTGVSTELVVLLFASYYIRMFGITGGYHRYFSHRAFKTGRVFQFLLAFLAETSMQKGVLWWASHHRHHHRYSDQEEDIHSPGLKGFWYSHAGWLLGNKYDQTRYGAIKDFASFPELRLLNKYWIVPPFMLWGALYAVGGVPYLLWGGIVATVLLWHGTFVINSLTHMFGKRRYLTTDSSRNSFILALVTNGEGWHNNHHFHQNTANQGWFWWEVDITYYVLRVLSWFGLVWDLRVPSKQTKYSYKKYNEQDLERLRAESKPGLSRLNFQPPLQPAAEA